MKKVSFRNGRSSADMHTLFAPAIKCKTKKQADEYFHSLVKYALRKEREKPLIDRRKRSKIIDTLRSNIGYFAGYYDGKTMARVYKLFNTTHPIFGDTLSTPEEAFELGKKLGDGTWKK